jgi:hypothetical protein
MLDSVREELTASRHYKFDTKKVSYAIQLLVLQEDTTVLISHLLTVQF